MQDVLEVPGLRPGALNRPAAAAQSGSFVRNDRSFLGARITGRRCCPQPCYVSMLSAPAEKHPGDCMIEGLESLNRCDGKYSMTSRLCPCI